MSNDWRLNWCRSTFQSWQSHSDAEEVEHQNDSNNDQWLDQQCLAARHSKEKNYQSSQE